MNIIAQPYDFVKYDNKILISLIFFIFTFKSKIFTLLLYSFTTIFSIFYYNKKDNNKTKNFILLLSFRSFNLSFIRFRLKSYKNQSNKINLSV